VLKAQVAAARAAGFTVKTGVEVEFFLLKPDASGPADDADDAVKPCYDQQALMRQYDLIAEVCDYMALLGWGPYQNDHEDANGQFEMNWGFADALVTADRHAFFKFMMRSCAEARGQRVTFMPKPFAQRTGTGAHVHVSAWGLPDAADEGRNLFHDAAGELGLSPLAYSFMAGVLGSAEGLCALTNPTVNSYKRLSGAVVRSGAAWSPNTVSYGGNNRTCVPAKNGYCALRARADLHSDAAVTCCAFRMLAVSSSASPTARATPTSCRRASSPRGWRAARRARTPARAATRTTTR
jgi:glutamine synthetase